MMFQTVNKYLHSNGLSCRVFLLNFEPDSLYTMGSMQRNQAGRVIQNTGTPAISPGWNFLQNGRARLLSLS